MSPTPMMQVIKNIEAESQASIIELNSDTRYDPIRLNINERL